jgi:hypothetical protein
MLCMRGEHSARSDYSTNPPNEQQRRDTLDLTLHHSVPGTVVRPTTSDIKQHDVAVIRRPSS